MEVSLQMSDQRGQQAWCRCRLGAVADRVFRKCNLDMIDISIPLPRLTDGRKQMTKSSNGLDTDLFIDILYDLLPHGDLLSRYHISVRNHETYSRKHRRQLFNVTYVLCERKRYQPIRIGILIVRLPQCVPPGNIRYRCTSCAARRQHFVCRER